MVFGAFLWILLALIPLQTSPAKFVVREIRACCHHQISLRCGDHHSKIAIIQARYVIDRGPSGKTATRTPHGTAGSHTTPYPVTVTSTKSISLRDIDLKFAQDFMGQQTEDGSASGVNQHLNSPDWFDPPPAASERKHGYLYIRKYKLNGSPGLNFTSRRPMEIPEYEGGFVDRDTVWREPLFPVVSSQNELSSSSFSAPCLSYEYLSSSSTAHVPRGQKYRAGVTDFPKGPNWQYKDLRGVFNQRCSGRSSCDVYLLWNKQRDEELTRVCHKWPDGLIVVKYLCYNSASGDVHSKCNEDISPAREGFLVNPGYPDLYPGDHSCQWRLHVLQQRLLLVLFDISLRGQEKSVCRDELIVSDDKTNLLSTCGDHSSAVAVLSLSHQVNVTLVPQSRLVFPKRGFLLYFRVIGCVKPEGPLNSNMGYRNATHAYFLCKAGYVFTDTLISHRWLECDALEHRWIPHQIHCQDVDTLLEFNSSLGNMIPGLWPVIHRRARGSFVSDFVAPVVVILILLTFNTIIVLYIRRRRNRQEEIENEENQEMEAIQAGETPEDSTFTLSSSDGMSSTPWDRPVMRFAEVDTTTHYAFSKDGYLLETKSDENLVVGEISPSYTTNGTVFFNVLPRSTPV